MEHEFEYCDHCGWAIEDCNCTPEDRECDLCGFKNGKHMIKCPNDTDPFHELIELGYD